MVNTTQKGGINVNVTIAYIEDIENSKIRHIQSIPEEYKDGYSDFFKEFNSLKKFKIDFKEVDENLTINDMKGDALRKNFNFKTSIGLKKDFLNYIKDNKIDDNRLFYISFNDSVIITDCDMDEIGKISIELAGEDKEKDTYTIQDIHNEKYVVSKEDLRRFCYKEIRFSNDNDERELTYEEKKFIILMSEYRAEFLEIYNNIKL